MSAPAQAPAPTEAPAPTQSPRPIRRVFLTGATGYVGQAVLPVLVQAGYEVTALVRRPVQLAGCRTVIGDLATAGALGDEVAASDAVVHLACSRSMTDRNRVLGEDVMGTGALLDAWGAGPFVYASSPTVCDVPGPDGLTETSPIQVHSWYDLGKYVNEFQLRAARPVGLRGPSISLRPGFYFAPNLGWDNLQYFAMVYAAVRLGRTLVFDSDESIERHGSSFIGGADFGRAIIASFGLTEPGAYDVAGGFTTWKRLIDLFAEHTGVAPAVVVKPREAPVTDDEFRLIGSRSLLSVQKFVTASGFQVEQRLEDLVAEFCTMIERTEADDGVVDDFDLPPDPAASPAGGWLAQFAESGS